MTQSSKGIEFPSLFTSQEVDELRDERRQPAGPAEPEPYYPFPIVEAGFPRIAESIRELWGTPELDRYFDRLLIDERGDRAGFPPEVVQALLALSQQHIEQFGFERPDNPWTGDPKLHKG